MKPEASFAELYERVLTLETSKRNPDVEVGDIQAFVKAATTYLKVTGNFTIPTLLLETGEPILGIAGVWADSASGPVFVDLPEVTQLAYTTPLVVKDHKGTASTNPITIEPFGSAQIDGQNTVVISTNYGSRTIVPDLTDGDWHLI